MPKLVAMSMFVVGRSLREGSTSSKSSLVTDSLVVLRQPVENIDNLLHWEGDQSENNTQTPKIQRESALSNMKCNRSKLNNKNLQYRRRDQDSAEQGISLNATEYIH